MRLDEIVDLPEKLKQITYYHGVPTEEGKNIIITKGLIYDPEFVAKKYKGEENFSPILGGAYLTKDFANAVRYSFMAPGPDEGFQEYLRKEPYSYVFEFLSDDFTDVSPDEDELGGFIEKLLKKQNLPPKLKSLVDSIPDSIKNALTQQSFESLALAGKWAVNNLSPATLKYLLQNYSNVVSYNKTLHPDAVWIIPKPKERFLPDRQGKFHSLAAYKLYAERNGTRYELPMSV